MPLVPLDHIKRWYRADSFICRQFSYLFVNQLWTKQVPKGAAVCAYFWSAMFSLFMFRPFVWLVLSIRWLLAKSHLTEAVRACDRLIWRLDGSVPNKWHTGIPTLVFGLILSLLAVFLYGMSIIYRNMADTGIVSIFWIGLLLFVSLFTAITVDESRPTPRLTCRRAFWAYASGLVFAAYLNHPDLFSQALGSVGGGTWDFITLAATESWWFVCWVAAGFAAWVYSLLSYVGYSIWNTGAAIIDHWVWTLCAVVGWAILTAIMWQYETSRTYMVSYYRDIRLKKPRARIMDEIAKRLAQEFEDSDDKPHMADYWVKRIKGSWAAWEILREIVDSDAWVRVKPEQLDLSISRQRLDQIAEAVWKEYQTERAVVKVANATNKVTTYLRSTYGAYWLKTLWSGVKWVWTRVIVVCAKNLMAFACVLWEIIKSRKQGWCPYLQIDRSAEQEAPRVN
jgi:hypothetical protein